ncbi:Poly(3-hydroxyalkanoate) polymerase subunit PhaC [Andreprevotia sp. IGB-42]|uniref:PHA/PHB synthase family protein n=1 Tax=Andreprevotia sp. IGB-42 TaxID=2497473 RepID=UPI00157E645E|nr:class I poly(R)-hydroxyalkanoic acid synthase [Andreprevotia sp. IGB-42]KAF0815429.1 Poly(3-hydroxyalkanoate) polymerase subunit PhaC [Andreprevotia sp. IGB-42]
MLPSTSLEALFQQLNDANSRWWQSWGQPVPPAAPATAPFLQSHGLPASWLETHADYYRQQLDLWLGLIGAKPLEQQIEPEKGDRRFNAPEWEQPLYAYLKQSYLLSSRWLMDMVGQSQTDETAREKLAYFTRQYLDAISPTNFAITNPEVLKLAIESKGESLQEGMKKMLEDVQRGSITMTDESQFEVGANLAVTPGAVVFENDLFQLLQYTPSTAKVYETPLLIVPPCVNKYYIMDLQPDNSMVRWVVGQGHTTFLVSWKSVEPEQGHLQWDDYVQDGVIKAAEVVREITKREKMNVLSFCIGGELVSTAIPVMQARNLDWFESLTLMTVIIDHTDPGDIKHFIDWSIIRKREAQLAAQPETGGVVSGKELARTFAALRANDLIWNYVVNNYLKGKTPPPFDLLYWNNDSANLALPMHTFFLKNMYLENNLTKPGSFSLCGVPIDLRQIELPTYVFAAREDHIVPWQSAYGTTRIFKGPLRFVLGASGHIAGTINPVSTNKRNYWVNDNLAAEPAAWFEGAESRAGSWWHDWAAWLVPHAGKEVAAKKTLGSAKFKQIEPAPGRYVRARLG